jgi:hypothetical protein
VFHSGVKVGLCEGGGERWPEGGGRKREPRKTKASAGALLRPITITLWQLNSRCDGQLVFPRKEVIQPQVPLRLPCYDFTPITDHTFGACPPYGLARRLQIQSAFVV